jgi:hypothetical protein
VPPGKVLGEGLDPADIRDAPFVGGSTTFSEHGRVGVEADRLLEQMGEPDGEDAWPATSIEEPAGPIQIQFLAENSLELRRVGRSTAPVVGSGALVDRGVVRHHHRMPAVVRLLPPKAGRASRSTGE